MVNLLSNIKAVGVNDLKISLEFDPSTKVASMDRQLSNLTITSWGVEINLGQVNYGQHRDIVVVLDHFSGEVELTTKYCNHGSTDHTILHKRFSTDHFDEMLLARELLYFKELLDLN